MEINFYTIRLKFMVNNGNIEKGKLKKKQNVRYN